MWFAGPILDLEHVEDLFDMMADLGSSIVTDDLVHGTTLLDVIN